MTYGLLCSTSSACKALPFKVLTLYTWNTYQWTDPRLVWNPDHHENITELKFFHDQVLLSVFDLANLYLQRSYTFLFISFGDIYNLKNPDEKFFPGQYFVRFCYKIAVFQIFTFHHLCTIKIGHFA